MSWHWSLIYINITFPSIKSYPKDNYYVPAVQFPPMMQKGQILKPYWTHFQVQLVHTGENVTTLSQPQLQGKVTEVRNEPCWSLDSGWWSDLGSQGDSLCCKVQSELALTLTKSLIHFQFRRNIQNPEVLICKPLDSGSLFKIIIFLTFNFVLEYS